MKKGLKIMGYFGYALVVALVLLYARFPSAAMRSYLVRAGDNLNPQLVIQAETLDLKFPPGLKLTKTAVSFKKNPDTAVFNAEDLSVSPSIGAFLVGDQRWFFDAGAYGGSISGHITAQEEGRIDGFSVSFKEIRIQKYPLPPDSGIGGLSGNLDGKLTYEGTLNGIFKGDGSGNIQVVNGKMDLSPPFLGLETVPFGQLNARFSLKKGTLNLASVSVSGKAFLGTLTGTVHLNRTLNLSRLNLRGTIEPVAGYLENIKGGPALLSILGSGRSGPGRSFVIQGTFRSPKFRFI